MTGRQVTWHRRANTCPTTSSVTPKWYIIPSSGDNVNLTLTDVVHVPRFAYNLFSLRPAADPGHECFGFKVGSTLRDRTSGMDILPPPHGKHAMRNSCLAATGRTGLSGSSLFPGCNCSWTHTHRQACRYLPVSTPLTAISTRFSCGKRRLSKASLWKEGFKSARVIRWPRVKGTPRTTATCTGNKLVRVFVDPSGPKSIDNLEV